MKIHALLSYYDEPPEMLAELIDSLHLAGVAGIVAVDGAYAEFPDAKPESPLDCTEVIRDTAHGHGMSYTMHAPSTPWVGNETQKRAFLFSLAHSVVNVGEDWFWVIDSDCIVEYIGDLHEVMASAETDVLELFWHEPGGFEAQMRSLFRSQESGINLGRYHAHYITGDGRSLWAACHRDLQEPSEQTSVRILHRPNDRPGGVGGPRNSAKRIYYERAVMLGIDEAII